MIDLGNNAVMDGRRTDESITDANIPDPEVLPRVAGDYILVRPVSSEASKTTGGIFLPETTQGDIKYLTNVGRVLKFGPRVYKKTDGTPVEWVEGGLAVGDIVQWERFVGKSIVYRGVRLVLLKDIAVQLVLENATDVDTTANVKA